MFPIPKSILANNYEQLGLDLAGLFWYDNSRITRRFGGSEVLRISPARAGGEGKVRVLLLVAEEEDPVEGVERGCRVQTGNGERERSRVFVAQKSY